MPLPRCHWPELCLARWAISVPAVSSWELIGDVGAIVSHTSVWLRLLWLIVATVTTPATGQRPIHTLRVSQSEK